MDPRRLVADICDDIEADERRIHDHVGHPLMPRFTPRLAEIIREKYSHDHVAGSPVIDECAACGRDLRNSIHTRAKAQ